ncbi:uncharacterized protein LOC128683867 isoform X2 [Plodia interpunctella]|uniref:uncharacterized protein LOC128683867 isoform X2 n=1 Tax=Plodia interpunctella TaxID=58824 RepID=UPI002368991F|nr:uncharacterized protein LOC128683867 isoform X2 [Plodia interpunctella]
MIVPNHVTLSRAPGTLWEMGNADAKKDEGQKTGKKTHRKLKDELDLVEKKACASCGKKCLLVFGVVLSVAVVLLSLAEIASTVSTAIATKLFSSELSGRVVAYIVLAVTAAVALSAAIFAVVKLFKKKKKSLKIVGGVLFLLAVIQAIIAGVSVKVTVKDEYTLAESLRESFHLAAQGNQAHVKKWATTSSDLQCCGLFGPEDYRQPNSSPLFPPDVPIYCCPTYNSTQSAILQEVARQICKSTRSYYKIGCGGLVQKLVVKFADMVLTISIVLIVLEVILSLYLHVVYIKNKKETQSDNDHDKDHGGENGDPKPEPHS